MMLGALCLLLFPLFAKAAALSVFGHKAPDTDATTSALVYAWELNARNITASAFVLGELNPETKYVLKTIGVETPPVLGKLAEKSEVAIVDTNNPDELPDGIDKAVVHSIVDHHKLVGGLKSAQPIEVDMRTLCSATSILYARAKAFGLTPPKHIAGLMLSGILSDSLAFRSPTTTPLDRTHAEELSKLAGLDMDKYADAMLEAKADIGHMSAAELVTMDSKIFKIGGKKLRVSVIETTKPAAPLAKQTELCEAMKLKASEESSDEVLMFIVDIIKEAASVLTCTSEASQIVQRAWPKTSAGTDGTFLLPGVLSRKKQMIPALEAAAAKKDEM